MFDPLSFLVNANIDNSLFSFSSVYNVAVREAVANLRNSESRDIYYGLSANVIKSVKHYNSSYYKTIQQMHTKE